MRPAPVSLGLEGGDQRVVAAAAQRLGDAVFTARAQAFDELNGFKLILRGFACTMIQILA